jgi:hypothetical protein
MENNQVITIQSSVCYSIILFYNSFVIQLDSGGYMHVKLNIKLSSFQFYLKFNIKLSSFQFYLSFCVVLFNILINRLKNII